MSAHVSLAIIHFATSRVCLCSSFYNIQWLAVFTLLIFITSCVSPCSPYLFLQHPVPPHVDQKLPGCSLMQISVQSSYFILIGAPVNLNYFQNKLTFVSARVHPTVILFTTSCICPCSSFYNISYLLVFTFLIFMTFCVSLCSSYLFLQCPMFACVYIYNILCLPIFILFILTTFHVCLCET